MKHGTVITVRYEGANGPVESTEIVDGSFHGQSLARGMFEEWLTYSQDGNGYFIVGNPEDIDERFSE